MEQESFRNSIGTVDTSGKRVWVFPKSVITAIASM